MIRLFSGGQIGGFRPILPGTNIFTTWDGAVHATSVGDPIGRTEDVTGQGFHAVQPTLANRPLLGRHPRSGKRNLLLATATMGTQNVTTANVEHTLHFTGTGTVTLTGTSTAGPLVGTGAGNRVSQTFTPTAGTLTLTVSGSVTASQLELGPSVTGIQTVVQVYDTTEVGQADVWFAYGNGSSMFDTIPGSASTHKWMHDGTGMEIVAAVAPLALGARMTIISSFSGDAIAQTGTLTRLETTNVYPLEIGGGANPAVINALPVAPVATVNARSIIRYNYKTSASPSANVVINGVNRATSAEGRVPNSGNSQNDVNRMRRSDGFEFWNGFYYGDMMRNQPPTDREARLIDRYFANATGQVL